MSEPKKECDICCQLYDRIIYNLEDEMISRIFSRANMTSPLERVVVTEPYPSINIDNHDGYKLKRIIYDLFRNLNLQKLEEKYNISVFLMDDEHVRYSEEQNFVIYWKGKPCGADSCPPLLKDLLLIVLEKIYGLHSELSLYRREKKLIEWIYKTRDKILEMIKKDPDIYSSS